MLVTGGNGFIASYIIRRLVESGEKVVALDMYPPSDQVKHIVSPIREKVVWEKGDVTDIGTLIRIARSNGVRRIVHMAAATKDPQLARQEPLYTHKIDVGGALNVLEAARILDLGRIVVASSVASYHEKKYEPIDEFHPVFDPRKGHPAGPHGATKVIAEIFGLIYFTDYGTDFISLRIASAYGFGMYYDIYIRPMVENSVRGIPTKFETGADMLRDYTYVEDLADGFVLALEADKSRLKQRVFNLATGHLISTGELAEQVKALIPSARIEVGKGLSEGERTREMTRVGELSIANASQQLGYEPRFTIRRGLEDYIAKFREYIGAPKDVK